jgi:FlaA1/EpsC-like NDP-sugar epimerase
MFARLEIVSRWIIFTIDVCLCIVALILAKVLKNNFIITNIDPLTLYKSIVISVVINALVFYNVKTFAGIVRYTQCSGFFPDLILSCSELPDFIFHQCIVYYLGVRCFCK